MSVMDDRRVALLAALTLTEPQFLTDADLDRLNLLALGATPGSLSDMRIEEGLPNFPGGSEQ